MNTDYTDFLTQDLFGVFDAHKPENRELFWAFLATTQPEHVAHLRTLNEALVVDLHAEAFRKYRVGQMMQRILGSSGDLRVTQEQFVLTN